MIKNNKIFLNAIFSIILLISLSGCENEETNKNVENKIIQELNYLDTEVISILNKLNNITLSNYTITTEEIQMEEKDSNEGTSGEEGQEEKTNTEQNESNSEGSNNSKVAITQMEPQNILSSDENDVDWEVVKKEAEKINEAWGAVVLDLSYANVNNTDILNFGAALNDILLSTKNENKLETLKNTAKLYAFIPEFEQQISKNEGELNVRQVKSYLINAYSLLEQEDWASIETNMINADTTFKNIINNIEFIKNREYQANKTYVLLKELQNSLQYQDKKLFLVKYKNLIENINRL